MLRPFTPKLPQMLIFLRHKTRAQRDFRSTISLTQESAGSSGKKSRKFHSKVALAPFGDGAFFFFPFLSDFFFFSFLSFFPFFSFFFLGSGGRRWCGELAAKVLEVYISLSFCLPPAWLGRTYDAGTGRHSESSLSPLIGEQKAVSRPTELLGSVSIGFGSPDRPDRSPMRRSGFGEV